MGVECQYLSHRRTLAGSHVGGFGLVNLTLLGHDLPGGWAVSAGVRNLLDKPYADPGAGEHLQDALAQDGRTYQFQATRSF